MLLSIDTASYTSPNFDTRGNTPVTLLVLHYTGMKTGTGALERLCDSAAKVSSHYVIEEDGRIFRLVEEQHRAWHAGVSYWRGMENVNAHSIGIEIVNPGHEYGYRPFPPAQMESVRLLCADIIARYGIVARNVVGHSDVAPERKEDPGELFDWYWLAQHGIGAWPSSTINHQPSTASIEAIQSGLIEYGYNLRRTRVWDEATRKVIIAFQRHFRPAKLDGIWDSECDRLLTSLLKIPAF